MSPEVFSGLRVGAYGVIYADPPWAFRGYKSDGVPQRSPEQHYPTMTLSEMAQLPVWRLAAPHCALLMWSTSSHTDQSFRLAHSWGFHFKSKAFCWAKLIKSRAEFEEDEIFDHPMSDSHWHMGMGYGTRRNTEDCWLFTRGAPERLDAGVRELVVSPLRDHSRKPDEMYEKIQRLYAGPYLELFARNRRAGWSSWGNQTDKF